MINEKFLKPYNPEETEKNIYSLWEQTGFFNPDNCIRNKITAPDAEKFSIVLPPPNVTGELHMGHAWMLAVEDIVVRFERMRGKKTLWVPGTDHAAIATQTRVEKDLKKETGESRHDLGRENFLKKVEEFAQKSHSTITNQIRAMGASVDWSREAFTLDKKRETAVRTAFKKMYDDGLIFRGNRIVNWDPKGQTVVSDEEVVHEPTKAKLYYFKYSNDFPITIATTRPETKLGDTAVAVNPNDARYKKYIGETFKMNFCGEPLEIKIIGEENVDPEFGTGAVGVTPAHSMVDFEMAERHNLPIKQVINEYGKITVTVAELKDKKTLEAREIILEWLKQNNLFEREEDIDQNISKAERSGGTIEPIPKLQWFIDVNKKFERNGKKTSLKELMSEAVSSEKIKILPERFEKIYFHWIQNLRPWCISRQIWYGHRIPVWYKNDEIYVGIESPDGDEWIQDEDTLDTWFSSGLWTFSTLGWPEKTDDLKTYHPTNLLETGYDIIFFWVARMILMSTYLLDEIPFETVYLHGILRDAKGRKMSKSLGNGLDPLELIKKFGADAVRMSLIVGIGPGNDTNLSEEKVKAYKKFANKIWNASRFVLENTEDYDAQKDAETKLTDEDNEAISEWQKIRDEITDDIINYRLYLASEKIYHYFWHTFADILIEKSKPNLNSENLDIKKSSQKMLQTILIEQLKVLHPFMPFITEEIWQNIYGEKENQIMVSRWPK